MTAIHNHHLDWLENESIYIIREIIAEAKNPALLFSGGKDSVVLLALARKAFQIPYRSLHSLLDLHEIDDMSFRTVAAGMIEHVEGAV